MTHSKHIQTLEDPDGGILDLEFDGNTIFTATSIGTIDSYELHSSSSSSQPFLQLQSKIRVAEPITVITSIALDTTSDGCRRIAFTASDGKSGLLNLPTPAASSPYPSPSNSYQDVPTHDVTSDVQTLPQQHTLEAWITVFSPPSWGPRTIFSGGDDATLLSHVEHTPSEWTPGLRDRKTHGAGITALLPLELSGDVSEERLLLTGSYDDRLRVLDLGSGGGCGARRPEVVGELDLGGGVWRINVLDQCQDDADGRSTVKLTLAVACMHAGAFIVAVRLEKGGDTGWQCILDVLHHMEEHESMCYGIDTRHAKSEPHHHLVSCSFYDRRLCLWRWPKPN